MYTDKHPPTMNINAKKRTTESTINIFLNMVAWQVAVLSTDGFTREATTAAHIDNPRTNEPAIVALNVACLVSLLLLLNDYYYIVVMWWNTYAM